MSRSSLVVALSVLVLISCTAAALADDINPPPWRGQSGTTFTKYEFPTPNFTPPPDIEVKPYGQASAEVNSCGPNEWYAEWAGRQGVWRLSGNISVTIPNSPVANTYKDIQVQLTWARQEPGACPIVGEDRFDVVAQKIQEIHLDETWMHTTYVIRIMPNPVWERVYIEGPVLADELVIDTTCAFVTPEPSSLVMLAGSMLGLAGLLWRRRR